MRVGTERDLRALGDVGLTDLQLAEADAAVDLSLRGDDELAWAARDDRFGSRTSDGFGRREHHLRLARDVVVGLAFHGACFAHRRIVTRRWRWRFLLFRN